MMTLFRSLGAGLLVLVLLTFAGNARAQDGAGGAQPNATITEWQQLLQLSGLERAIRELPTYFKLGLDQAKAQGAPIAPEVEAALKAAADEVFDFQILQSAAIELLQASLSPQQLSDWLAFYRLPLGKKLAAADEQAAAPDFQILLMQRAPQVLETLSQDPGRMALLQSFLQATETVEQATNMAMQIQLALEWGLISTMPQELEMPTFEELKHHIDEQRFVLRAQMAQLTLAHTAAAYQEFSLEELGQMLQRANSPAGKALYVNFSRRLYQTLVALTEKMGQSAGRRLAQQAI